MALSKTRTHDRLWLHLGLVGLTLLTTGGTYYWMFGMGRDDALRASWVFALSLVGILGSHEMGHYLLARWHGVDTSLPYFIPLPFIGLGTLGAVIRIRGPIPNRNALVDIGAAGPLAGLLVALPILWVGLSRSTLVAAPEVPPLFLGDNSLWQVGRELWGYVHALATGAPVPAAAAPPERMYWMFGDNLLLSALERLRFGVLPPGVDVAVDEMVVAGWFGLLVTMLNLLPLGQLDGGHLSFAVLQERAPWLGRAVALLMALACLFFTWSWLLWLLLTTRLIGFGHPPVTEPRQPLSKGRAIICALCLVALVVCVMPVPVSLVAIP